MKVNWREKVVAAAIHFLATALIASIAAALIFLVWFPGALAEMVGGTRLFWLVLGVDLSLGPLLSLVIYNSGKSRRELITDYCIVGGVQLAALIYGVWVVSASRPVFIAFQHDRFEIVTAIELDDPDLEQGSAPQFRSRSWTGPRLVAVESPTDAKEREALLGFALQGKDSQLFPKYYRDFATARSEVLRRGKPLDTLLTGSGAAEEFIQRAIRRTGKDQRQLRWMLTHHRFGFATVLVDAQTGEPLEYIAVDPVWTSAG